MKAYRRIAMLAMLTLILCMSIVFPVCAAKPQKCDCGLLQIMTGEENLQLYMAVCVAEADGNYVYSGNRPIQQQTALYASATNDLYYNNYYEIEEDTEYDSVQGVYRFELKEKVETGSQADVFPKMAEVSVNETVYFVHLDMDENDIFVMEKTTVKSIWGGALTTKDGLEAEQEEGDFSVIFNDNGEVVGFCKSGVATAPLSGNSGGSYVLWGAAIVLAVGVAVWLIVKRTKKSEPIQTDNNEPTQWGDDVTRLESDIEPSIVSQLGLRCHGGYLNGRTYLIPQEGFSIGRDSDNSIRYPAQTPGISRHHVKLFWQNGQLMLMDLDSSNGTYLNQTGRIAPMQPVSLRPGDVFYLGEKLNAFEIIYK